MKRFLIVLAMFLAVIGVVSSQQWCNYLGFSQNITITGTLQLQNGTIAVVNGTNIYYVPALERYIGFIEGLKEGTQVNLEGFSAGNGNYIQPSRLTLNGKTYDFPVNNNNNYTMNSRNGYGRNDWGNRGWCCR
jgi:hypothetical protein